MLIFKNFLMLMSRLFNVMNLNFVNYLVVMSIEFYNVFEKTEFLLQISCFSRQILRLEKKINKV